MAASKPKPTHKPIITGKPKPDRLAEIFDRAISDEELSAAFKAVLQSAQAGSLPALKELLDRRFGKAVQRHDHNGAESEGLKIIVEYVGPDHDRSSPSSSSTA